MVKTAMINHSNPDINVLGKNEVCHIYFILLIKCQNNNFNKNTAPYSCKDTDTKYLSKTLSK